MYKPWGQINLCSYSQQRFSLSSSPNYSPAVSQSTPASPPTSAPLRPAAISYSRSNPAPDKGSRRGFSLSSLSSGSIMDNDDEKSNKKPVHRKKRSLVDGLNGLLQGYPMKRTTPNRNTSRNSQKVTNRNNTATNSSSDCIVAPSSRDRATSAPSRDDVKRSASFSSFVPNVSTMMSPTNGSKRMSMMPSLSKSTRPKRKKRDRRRAQSHHAKSLNNVVHTLSLDINAVNIDSPGDAIAMTPTRSGLSAQNRNGRNGRNRNGQNTVRGSTGNIRSKSRPRTVIHHVTGSKSLSTNSPSSLRLPPSNTTFRRGKSTESVALGSAGRSMTAGRSIGKSTGKSLSGKSGKSTLKMARQCSRSTDLSHIIPETVPEHGHPDGHPSGHPSGHRSGHISGQSSGHFSGQFERQSDEDIDIGPSGDESDISDASDHSHGLNDFPTTLTPTHLTSRSSTMRLRITSNSNKSGASHSRGSASKGSSMRLTRNRGNSANPLRPPPSPRTVARLFVEHEKNTLIEQMRQMQSSMVQLGDMLRKSDKDLMLERKDLMLEREQTKKLTLSLYTILKFTNFGVL